MTAPNRVGHAAGTSGDDALWPYLNVLLRWKRVLVALPVSAAVLTAAITLLLPRKYVAYASFVPAQTTPAIGGQLGTIAASFGIDGLSQLASGSGSLTPQFYADLLRSRELLHETIVTRYSVDGATPFTGTIVDYADPWTKAPRERELDAIEYFERRMLSVTAERTTGVVALHVKTKNPLLSEAVAQRMLDLVNEFNLRRRQTQATAERDFVERRAEEAQAALRDAEGALARFQAANRGYEDSPQLLAQETQLQRQVMLAQQLFTSLSQRLETSRLEAVRNTPMVTVIDRPDGLAVKAKRYVVLKTLLAGLLGFVVAVIGVFTIERVRRSQHPDAPGYAEYLTLRGRRRTPA